MIMSNQNLAAIERAVAAFNDPPNRERYFDLYANDVVLLGFPPGLPAGVAGVKAFFHGFWEAFPDARLRGEDVVVGENGRVAIRYSIEGTHRGAFAGLAPTGKKVTVNGQTIVRFVDGKVSERWNAADMLGLMQQLGAIPS
jgi:predicted ester cyclase